MWNLTRITTYQVMLMGLYAAGGIAVVPVLLGLDHPVVFVVLLWSGHFLWEWHHKALLTGRAATFIAYALSLLILWWGPGTIFDRIYLFLLWLLTVRYLAPKGVRDAFQILILSVSVLAAGGVLYPDPLFALIFLIFLAISIFTAALTYVYAEIGNHPLKPQHLRSLLFNLLPYEGLTLLLSIFFFLFLPRSSFPLFAPALRTSGTAVGIHDTLNLGTFRELLEDATPVARVVPQGSSQRQGPLYLRLRVWGETPDGRRWIPWEGSPARPSLPPSDIDIYEMVIEPLGIPTLPVVEGTYLLKDGLPPSRWHFRADGTVWIHPLERGLRHRYVVWRRRTFYRDPPLPVFRSLPSQIPSILVDTLKAWVGSDSLPPRLIADRIQKRLWQFTYTLQDPPGKDHPLENFLRSRRGYCEYFATTMVLMLRILGIPARVVGGLAGGQWNTEGHYWLFRQQDAHTWVEAWIPEEGWVRFDPTPPVRFSEEVQREWVGASALWDYLRLLWARRVVQYSQEDQIQMALAGMEGVRRKARWFVISIIGLSLLVMLLRKRSSTAEDPIRREMLSLLKWMENHWPRHPQEGLRDYARRIGLREFENLVERYYAYRFGNHPIPLDVFQRQVQHIRQRLTRKVRTT